MGWALAEAARDRGARVTLVAGPVCLPNPKNVRLIRVESARGMLAATRKASRAAHAVIGAAAVADWRPLKMSRSKLKKGAAPPALRLTANPDVLATLARQRRSAFPRLAGFALETNRLLANAKKKLAAKSLDLVVANSPAALGSDRSRAYMIEPGRAPVLFFGNKKKLAELILTRLLEAIRSHE